MQTFFGLIDRLNAHPEQKDELETQIWQQYGFDKAVLALDMSGFSLTVRRQGIIAYLAKIRKMQHCTQPLILQHNGELVKYSADNLMATFDDCQQALLAAIDIRQQCQQQDAPVSIGLDFGRILTIPQQDCYGDAVNIAYKLGEDLAEKNEILVSDNFYQQITPHTTVQFESHQFHISGLEFKAYSVAPQK
jgi:class 3 adenylate cyclase